MRREEHCPCCKSRSFALYPAVVAPFIASYVLDAPPRPTPLLECRSCGFRFFEERYTGEEVEKLYAGYRGDTYFNARHRFEPWYTRAANDLIGSNSTEIAARKTLAGGFIREHVQRTPLDSILDYGGDRGQFIPDGVARNRFVYDISGVRAEEDVEQLSSPEEISGRTFDIIMLAHVLEHLSDPSAILDEVRRYAKSDGSYVFIEVPYERYNLAFVKNSGAYKAYLSAACRLPKPALVALDFYSTLFRVRFACVPPLGFAKLSEHINFFTPESLEALLVRNGFQIVASRIASEAKTSVGFQGTLLCLARTAAKSDA